MWTHKKVDLARHPVTGCAPSRRCGEVSSVTWFRKPGSSFQSQQAGSMHHSHRGRRWWGLYSLNLLVKLMVLNCQIFFSLAIAEAILMRISTKQVPSLHKVGYRYFTLVLAIHTNICTDVRAVGHDFAFLCYFHSISPDIIPKCWLGSKHKLIPYVIALSTGLFGEVKKFITAACIWAFYQGDRCVMVMECFLHDLLLEQVEQDGWE